MDQKKPSLEEIQRAFAVTSLEPEISEETLSAYASGQATAIERELVETMLEVDPSLSSVIAAIREELATVNEPLVSDVRAVPGAKRSGWLSQWLPVSSTLVAVGACCLLALAYLDRTRLVQEVNTKGQAVAFASEENRKKVKSLQQEIDLMQKQVGSNKADQQKLVAQLEQSREELKRLREAHPTLPSTLDGVKSMVAQAIAKGLAIPGSIAAISINRGTPDLHVSTTPDRTAVRLPVKLSWSGGEQSDYHVAIMLEDGTRVWDARVSGSSATPPDGILKPGVVYTWLVASGAKRGPKSVFRTLNDSDAKRAKAIDKDLRLGTLDKGVMYAGLGLVTDAEAQFKQLRAGDSKLADRLTQQLENSRK